MTIKHTHWLFGMGPNNELYFKEPVEVETDCRRCIHNKVCKHKEEELCSNYKFGTSAERGCHSCLHHYTRFDKDKVPCFTCKHFIDKDSIK